MRLKLIACFCFFAILIFPTSAFAYLDPGTGSMILQGIIAGAAIVGFAIKTYWYRILGFFGKKPPVDILDEDDQKTEDQI